jgi:hypothetical protein
VVITGPLASQAIGRSVSPHRIPTLWPCYGPSAPPYPPPGMGGGGAVASISDISISGIPGWFLDEEYIDV